MSNLNKLLETYTNLSGETVTVDTLEWLEDDSYWIPDDENDDENDFNDAGEYHPCSRYYIGTDAIGDSISVWLNDDMQEVEV